MMQQQGKAKGQRRALVTYSMVLIIMIVNTCYYHFATVRFTNIKLGNELDQNSVSAPTESARITLGDTNELVIKSNYDHTLQTRRQIDRNLHNSFPAIGTHEAIFSFFIGNLFREDQSGIISIFPPSGSFLDVGCQFGEQAAHYAVVAPEREVIAMDPSPANLKKVMDAYGQLENLKTLQGGIGIENGVVKVPDTSFHMEVGSEFPVYTLDSLFYEKGKKLAFAHIDVEGAELNALKGGRKTIFDSYPIFTTELRVHKDVNYTNELLSFLFDLGYDTYMINEVCGYPHMDYRNLLNVPRKLSLELQYSDTFVSLHATESIFRIPVPGEQKTTIFDLVVPCCALGGECCPGADINDPKCCSEDLVHKWMEKNKPDVNPYFYTWKASRQEFQRLYYRLRQRQKLAAQ